ncbi:MAG: hypothetical protein AAF289_10735, partial [Cyanobacteria bacterium P01_A01_bin.135]
MPEYLSISKQTPQFPEYLNFQVLRDIGIRHLQALSSDLWTDYNLHDPGVTILEVLCYAVTDLGYRNNLDIEDLLALNPADPSSLENNFFTPDEILTCNPVTDLDLRKRLIDIPGVRNAQLKKVGVIDPQTDTIPFPYEPAIEVDLPGGQLRYSLPSQTLDPDQDTSTRLHPRGLYMVCLDLDDQYRINACGQLYRDWSTPLDEVKRVLCGTRSLCEDVEDILVLGEEEIGLCADIQLATGADAEDVLVEIYVRVQAFLSPRLQFYTLQALLERGKSPAEIFAGRPMALHHEQRPYRDRGYGSHGFIDVAELAELTPTTVLRASDLYQIMLDVPGVLAVKKLSLINYINGLRQSQGHPWSLRLTENYRPVLGIQHSVVRLSMSDLPIPVDGDEVTRRYYEQQAAHVKILRDPYELDLSVPQGRYANLADYYAIHHEFPLTYGIGEDGLPDGATALRQAQARQLKGYLVFFDQLLANYLAQLSHIRDLFSWDIDSDEEIDGYGTRSQAHWHTYFNQVVDFPGIEEILPGAKASGYLTAIEENRADYRDRRSRLLDHLLARFAESFADYVLLNYRLFDGQPRDQFDTSTLRDKARFLQEYPILSHDRFRAFNYCDCHNIWNTDNVSGFQKRVARLLGIQDVRRRNLNPYAVTRPCGVLLALSASSKGPSLASRAVYASPEEALANRHRLLQAALQPKFYRRLTYTAFFQYGWEVRFAPNTSEPPLSYDAYFPSRAARRSALLALIATIKERLAPAEPVADPDGATPASAPTSAPASSEGYTEAVLASDDEWGFQLVIPAEDEADIRFTSQARYLSQQDAVEAGEAHLAAMLQAVQQQQSYCGVRLRAADGAEPTQVPYYGYALTGADGEVIAETALINPAGQPLPDTVDRFITEAERDRALQRWLCHTEANQNKFQFVVASTPAGWRFWLQPLPGEPDLHLRSLVTAYPSPEAAWQAATVAAASLRRWGCYASSVQVQGETYALAIQDADGAVLMVSDTDLEAATVFRRLNDIDGFLRVDPIAALGQGAPRYRFRLVDRPIDGCPEVTLLEGAQLYADEDKARDSVYQALLTVLFEPGVICPTQSHEGFGFHILSRPRDRRSTVAQSPEVYGTEAERDWAIERVLLLVRTARFALATPPLTATLPAAPAGQTPAEPPENPGSEASESPEQDEAGYLGQIKDDHQVLLQGRLRHP